MNIKEIGYKYLSIFKKIINYKYEKEGKEFINNYITKIINKFIIIERYELEEAIKRINTNYLKLGEILLNYKDLLDENYQFHISDINNFVRDIAFSIAGYLSNKIENKGTYINRRDYNHLDYIISSYKKSLIESLTLISTISAFYSYYNEKIEDRNIKKEIFELLSISFSILSYNLTMKDIVSNIYSHLNKISLDDENDLIITSESFIKDLIFISTLYGTLKNRYQILKIYDTINENKIEEMLETIHKNLGEYFNENKHLLLTIEMVKEKCFKYNKPIIRDFINLITRSEKYINENTLKYIRSLLDKNINRYNIN
ncbi:hypothetical protein YN1_8370 [Nanoarchaeota archaeon]